MNDARVTKQALKHPFGTTLWPTRERLLLLPPAGAGAQFWRPLGPWLTPHFCETFAFCAPGREHRVSELPEASIEALARSVLEELPEDGARLTIVGYSMGTAVAFEVCHQLHSLGRELPSRLIVCAAAPPMRRRPWRPLTSEELRCEIGSMGGTPREVLECPELWALIEPPLRSDLQLLDAYRPPAHWRVPCPVTAIAGLQDLFAPETDMLAWRECCTGAFDHLSLAGGHFFLFSQLQVFARAVVGEIVSVGGVVPMTARPVVVRS